MTLERDKLVKILGLLGSDKTGEIWSAARTAVALICDANTSWAELLNQNAIADDGRTLIAELRLRAENEKLREMVMQVSAENHALREQAAGGLAHRIRDGVKQSGQALRGLAIAFDGSAPRAQHVVVHGLVAAGIALALGIGAFLALHDVPMLGAPSVGSRTMASPEQKTPEATARSGELPAQAERRGSISDQLSSAAKVTPEAVPRPPATDAALAPLSPAAAVASRPSSVLPFSSAFSPLSLMIRST